MADPTQWILAGSAAFGVLVATLLTIAVLLQRERAERRQRELLHLHTELQTLREELDHTGDRLDNVAAVRDRMQEQLLTVRARLGEAMAELRTSHEGAEEREQRIARLDGLLSEREGLVARLRGDVKHLRSRLEELRAERAGLEVRTHAAEQTLAAIGLDLSEPPVDPLAPARRAASGSVLRQLLLDAAADAVALVDARGLVQIGVGPDVGQQRLARASAALEPLLPALTVALCGPVATASIEGPVHAQHLLRFENDGHWLGLESHEEAPRFAMQRALLQLQGRPEPAPAAPQLPDAVGEGRSEPDPALEASIRAWAERWKATDVVVLDAGTVVRAATPGTDVGAAVVLRHEVVSLWRRSMRDGLPLPRLTLRASRHEGDTVHLRAVSDDLDTAMVFAITDNPLIDEAIDELCGLVRWRAAAPVAEAS